MQAIKYIRTSLISNVCRQRRGVLKPLFL